jgi:uncharacterized membrane-anchored protein
MALRAASAALFLFAALSFTSAGAQPATAPPSDPQRAAENKQIQDAAKRGPVDVTLHDEAVLSVPKGEIFLPAKEADILLRRMGNFHNDRLLGMILPEGEGNWFVVAEFNDSGYVKDEEGKDIDAGKLLQGMKDGTEEENKERREKGADALRVTRWIEPPHYDQASRHLVWSIELESLDAKDKVIGKNLNYNTYALGRGGFIELNLVTDIATVENDKAHVRQLLSNLHFMPGKRYEDFNASTDKVAAFGLLALIGGLAAKKLGLLALAGVFLVKFAKIIFAACIAGFAVFRKFLRKKDDAVDMRTAPAASPPSQDPPSIVS